MDTSLHMLEVNSTMIMLGQHAIFKILFKLCYWIVILPNWVFLTDAAQLYAPELFQKSTEWGVVSVTVIEITGLDNRASVAWTVFKMLLFLQMYGKSFLS